MGKATHDGRRGWLFVFEGIDGSGKTTQLRRAAETVRTRGLRVVELVEPTNGPYGRQIRAASRAGGRRPPASEEAELFILDRMEDVQQNIAPALQRGDVVLLDRYYFSTIAYQGARGLDPDDIRRRNESFAPHPDLVLYFDVPLDEAMRRIESQRPGATDLFERRDYLARVKEIYDDLARRDKSFQTIDAGADEETVARRVIAALDRCLAARRKN
jgi:dTMP kinase